MSNPFISLGTALWKWIQTRNSLWKLIQVRHIHEKLVGNATETELHSGMQIFGDLYSEKLMSLSAMSNFSVKLNSSGDFRIILELSSEFSCKYFCDCFSWTLPCFFHVFSSNAVCTCITSVTQIWKTTPNKILIYKNITAI